MILQLGCSKAVDSGFGLINWVDIVNWPSQRASDAGVSLFALRRSE